VEIAVTDSGHGIDPSHLTHVFDPFFTTRDVGEGTGLGLSVCYGIARDHGGEIRVESEPYVATTFRLLLPAHGRAARAGEIVVALGDQAERDFVTAALRGWGDRPVLAPTLGEALSACRRPQVRAAIVDRGLLAAEAGAWTRLRAERPELTMAVTAIDADDAAIAQVGRAGRLAVLVPPVGLRSLQAAVRARIKERV
jgi:hypothetical protein